MSLPAFHSIVFRKCIVTLKRNYIETIIKPIVNHIIQYHIRYNIIYYYILWYNIIWYTKHWNNFISYYIIFFNIIFMIKFCVKWHNNVSYHTVLYHRYNVISFNNKHVIWSMKVIEESFFSPKVKQLKKLTSAHHDGVS